MNVPLAEQMRLVTRRDIGRSIEVRTPGGYHELNAPWWRVTDPIGNNAYVGIRLALQKLRP